MSELSTYAKKVVPSLVSSFLDVLSEDRDALRTKAESMIAIDSADSDITFLLSRGIGHAVLAYLDYDIGASKERLAAIVIELSTLRDTDVSQDILAAIAKTKPAEHGAIIASFPTRAAALADSISALSIEKAILMDGAALAFRDAFDSAIRWGEIRDVSNAGNTIVKLDPGVYRPKFKSHMYRLDWRAADRWEILEVNAKKLTSVCSYATVMKSEILVDGKTPQIKSATMARKIAKLCYCGYRGYADPVSAIASAVNASFEALSAGNPTDVNFACVSTDPSAWYAETKNGTVLPKEPSTPSK